MQAGLLPAEIAATGEGGEKNMQDRDESAPLLVPC